MVYELLRGYNRKHISPRCVNQMDIQKAYNTVEWTTLKTITKEMKFPSRFIAWIMECVCTGSYRYSIIFQIIELLKAKRGVMQGDPISPILFVLIMEYLHISLTKLQLNQNSNFPRCEKLCIINISFADDLIMFTRGDRLSVSIMMKVFNDFS